MLREIVVLLCLPAIIWGKKCTNQPNSTSEAPTATEGPTTTVAPTTMDLPPPESWPSGRFALLRAGSSCPQFFSFRAGFRYQDSEDYRNGNSWPTDSVGLPGRMKSDGYEFHYCTKHKGPGSYRWPEGNYCILRSGNKCPANFQNGFIMWDDENIFNNNQRGGRLPAGVYDEDTKIFFCCREDGDVETAIDLPVTRPFYLYRFSGESCQKVRKMAATEEIVQWDDEDTNNQNNKTGAYPYNSGNSANHRLHLCLYQQN